MTIAIEEVEYVARLARLILSEKEKDIYTEQLNSILDYMEKLGEVDTADVEPTFHVIPSENVVRDDQVRESFSDETALQNAPDPAKGCFRVPRII